MTLTKLFTPFAAKTYTLHEPVLFALILPDLLTVAMLLSLLMAVIYAIVMGRLIKKLGGDYEK